MIIAIDCSQVLYQGTGVAKYTQMLVSQLLKLDSQNTYKLFAYSFRGYSNLKDKLRVFSDKYANVKCYIFPFP